MNSSHRTGGLVRRARTHLALTAAGGLVVAGAVTGYLALDGGTTASAQTETAQTETAQTQTAPSETTEPSTSNGLSSTDQSGQADGRSQAS